MFKNRLRELQETYKIKNKEFADTLGISVSTLSKYKNGKREPSFELLCRIADYFNVTTDYMLGKTNIKSIDKVITLEGFKNNFKNYPSETIDIIDKIYSIITSNNDSKKLDSIKLILTELNNLLNE